MTNSLAALTGFWRNLRQKEVGSAANIDKLCHILFLRDSTNNS